VIPDPFGILPDVAGSIAGWSFEQVATGIARWVLGAIADLIGGVLNFLKTSARPDVTDAWFSGANSPYAAVRNVSAVLLIAFLLAGIIQGLMAGDVGGMFRRVAMDAPLAVLGMIGTTVIVDLLLDLTDAMSTSVLGGGEGEAVRFLEGFGASANLGTAGFSSVVIGLFAVLATMLIWIELMVRSSLMYLLVALSPLAFAASVWPAAKGVLRRLIEVMLAVILSKLVISVALAVGVAALGGAGGAAGSEPAVGEWAAQGLGGLVVGTSILCLAAFSPFMVLKLMPMVEGALVAQGMSRAPLNSARSGMNTAYYGRSLGRLGGGQGGSGDGSAPPPDATAPPFGPPGEPGVAGSAGAEGATGSATGAAGSGAGTGAAEAGGATAGTAGATGGGAAAGGSAAAAGAGTAAAGAVAGPAAIGVAAIEGAKAAKDSGKATAEDAVATVGASSGAGSEPGWRQIPNEPSSQDPSEPPPGDPR
jgi:hypothetical protein